MATSQPTLTQERVTASTDETATVSASAQEDVQSPSLTVIQDTDEGERILGASCVRLPIELNVAIPVRDFRVRNLLALEPGCVIETQWPHGEDMPVSSADVQLAWSEFEVIDTQLAVRLTRLA